MHDAAEPSTKKGPASIEVSSPEADDFRFRSGGLQGPLFSEVQLLEAAIAKYGRSGFLRRRVEADKLMVRDSIKGVYVCIWCIYVPLSFGFWWRAFMYLLPFADQLIHQPHTHTG